MAKYKVFNNNKFVVGIKFQDGSHREVNIAPNTSRVLEEDDILYIDAVSKLFKKGVIYVEDVEIMEKLGFDEKNPNAISDKEVSEILKLSAAKMKTALNKIEEQHAINKVVEKAKQDENLSQAKLKIIGDVFDVDIFDDINNEVI